jgi:tetratricopeptide (TPR) repeat protein
MRSTSISAALAVGSFVLAAGWHTCAVARSALGGEDRECADTANAENAIAACARLAENRGLGRRNRAIALGNRGAALKQLGRYDEAIADLGRAIDLDAGNPQYYCQRGDVRLRTGANNEATADYTMAIGQSPRLLWAYRGRGQAYLALGDGEKALADFNEAVRLKPEAFSLLVLRGRANNLVKNYDAAIADLTQALANPKSSALLPQERAAVLTQRAYARAKLDRAGEAQADIDEALRMAPKVAFTVAVSGLVNEKQGRLTEARDAYARSLTIEPDMALAKLGLERLDKSRLPNSAEASEPLAQSDPISEPPSSNAPEPVKEPQPGSDQCAKYVPEIGRTVRVKCAE